MGTKNTKPPESSAIPAKTSSGGIIQNLKEDIMCSICLETFEDPVTIDCGHNFCRGCLSAHWSGYSYHGYLCPECRHPCSPERMKSDIRLRSLVEKIGQMPLLKLVDKESGRADVEEVPTTPLQLKQPVQLVGLDENGDICLDGEALSHCLEQEQVKDAHVCLVSILGEQRRGKSFLLNFLLRRFQNLVAEDDSWMGQENDPLTGFDWRPGAVSTTKGVWIWNQPFWVPTEHGKSSIPSKVAVFLIDTEGSMDLERSKEAGVKLSAFSMLLSSYQILNLVTTMKDTDLEYLDMFVYVAEKVGRIFKLNPTQQLDVLVRDWFFPPQYGLQEGHKYLQEVIEKLKCQPGKHPHALGALMNVSTRCYLMPFPGKKLVKGTGGTLADMDDDFRECLKDYGNGIARSSGMHVKRNEEGTALTGAELASKIKKFASVMKQHQFGFTSATQMAIIIHNLVTLEDLREEFAEFIRKQDQNTATMIKALRVTPKSMVQRLRSEQQQLVQRCEMSLQGDEPGRTDSILQFESHLQADAKVFQEHYSRRYKSYALKAGLAFGVGVIGFAGGAIGAGVAGAFLAAEAIVLGTGTATTVAIGTAAGAGTLGLIGGGVGAGVGNSIGKRRVQEAEHVGESDAEVEEPEDNLSDETCLIDQQDTR
ncbi:RING finger protein 112 isoform X2 [Anolis carolinensis]|uniref:RING-type domain-containing protein n=1 Tax=Anolis carolinensis TaxID=28377 RepID=H9GCA4_ANOCA|nr:PREDICTED: RING finger protein 112 isoform X2 [Anolis carolinensis]XP_008115759.1 PREDICTED: RING finger protein 112 isoform X2 [Anolis carolinensis]|eukprot:XP_008115758.1 PREDICTED: RING finger protein 112 isoform X2 [Anolis carolinensis]